MPDQTHSIRCGCGASLVTASSALVTRFMSAHQGHDRLRQYPPYIQPDPPRDRKWWDTITTDRTFDSTASTEGEHGI